jgi:hypothetical protein
MKALSLVCLLTLVCCLSAEAEEKKYRFLYVDEMSLTTCMAKANKWAEELDLQPAKANEDGSLPLVNGSGEERGRVLHANGICRIEIYE